MAYFNYELVRKSAFQDYLNNIKTNKMSTRCKFKCESVTDFGNNNQDVKLAAVYAGDKNAEDNQFSAATPRGEMTMTITNPAVIGFFKPGKSYYLDISECE